MQTKRATSLSLKRLYGMHARLRKDQHRTCYMTLERYPMSNREEQWVRIQEIMRRFAEYSQRI